VRFQRFCLEYRHTLKDIDAVIGGVVKIEQTLSRWDRQNRESRSGITPISSPAPVVRPAPQAPGKRAAFLLPSGSLKVVMKIAQIAPLIDSVPPRLYGGTERIVSYLTEELARLGHDVTLFASGDSITSAELAPCCTRALRLDSTVGDIIPHFMLLIDKVRERAHEFDILHFHIDLVHFPLFRSLAARTLTTLHGRQDLGDLKPFYFRFSEMPLVSISKRSAQTTAARPFCCDGIPRHSG
jgi:hypothetical protein